MKYSEQTLQNWTAPLSATEEKRAEDTIKMIKSAIDSNEELRRLDYEVFTQGSFANNTNVRSESDVDVCVMLTSSFYYHLPEGKSPHDYGFTTPAIITFQRYRELVKKALEDKFGERYVTDGNKSLKVKENTYHVQADIVPAFQYRYYVSANNRQYAEGICFYTKDKNEKVVNYPKQHIQNGRTKNNRTNRQYKALVRIMKHIKNDMVEENRTNGDVITSFLVECLVWNVPDNIITGYQTWTETVKNAIAYLHGSIENGKYKEWGEVSEKLYLFHNGRKWSANDVKEWLLNAWTYIGF